MILLRRATSVSKVASGGSCAVVASGIVRTSKGRTEADSTRDPVMMDPREQFALSNNALCDTGPETVSRTIDNAMRSGQSRTMLGHWRPMTFAGCQGLHVTPRHPEEIWRCREDGPQRSCPFPPLSQNGCSLDACPRLWSGQSTNLAPCPCRLLWL